MKYLGASMIVILLLLAGCDPSHIWTVEESIAAVKVCRAGGMDYYVETNMYSQVIGVHCIHP